MKNYIEYLKENPNKMTTIQLVMLFCVVINVVVNAIDFNLWLSISVAFFSTILTFLINVQVWGEYKQIEGVIPAIKALFKWK